MLSIQDGPKLAALAIVVGTVGYNAVLLLVVKPMVLKQMRKELGTEVSIKTLVIRPLAGVFELRGLVVKGDTSTTFATIEKLRCTTTGPLGTLSLAGPQTFSLRCHVPWVVGFRGKMIEQVNVEGCTVVVDEGNGAFWKRRDARLKAKSAAKKRRVLEKELRWRLLHVDDKDAVRRRLELLRSLDGEDSDSDDEHEAYMESAAADWDAEASSPGKQSYAERLQAARERVQKRVAARVQARAEDQAQRELQEDLKKTYATIRPAFDDELIHIGSLAVERCAVTLRGRKVRLDHAVRVAAYCGTMRDFQKLVVKRVMTAALADSVQHKREKVREKIKEKAGEARASLNEKVKAVNETRAAVRKRIFGAGKEAVPDQAS